MSTYSTTRPIDLVQLATELDGAGLSMTDDGTERTIACHDDTITQEQLEAAVEAHVPAPPKPSTDARLQAQVDELADLILMMLEGL